MSAKYNFKEYDFLERIIAAAKTKGADYADVRLLTTTSQRVTVRLKEREAIENAEKAELGIRIFKNRRQALASTTRMDDWQTCLDSVFNIVSSLPKDKWAEPPSAEHLGSFGGELDMDDQTPPTLALEERAKTLEAAALGVKGITNSEGAAVSRQREGVFIASTIAEPSHYFRSGFDAVVSVVAGRGTEMVRDYEWRHKTHEADLGDPIEMGQLAARAAVAALNPQKPKSEPMAVVFSPRAAASLLSQLETLLDGQNAAAATTLLKDKMGDAIAADSISLINDPTRRRGAASYPFDVERAAARSVALIENGVFRHWLLDNRCALRLGLKPLGHAAGKPSVQPHPKSANLYLAAGKHSPTELMADIKRGLYVTELLGLAFNRLSGDLSRGAAGFLIEGGELAGPVAEVTIAANIMEMLKRMTAAADLEFRYGSDSPTIRVEVMTVAGR